MVAAVKSKDIVEPLITAREAAHDYLGVSTKTLWKITAPRGPIPCVRLRGGKLVRYAPSQLRDYIRRQTVGTLPTDER